MVTCTPVKNNLFAHDFLSSLGYPIPMYTCPIVPIKTLVANKLVYYTYIHIHAYTSVENTRYNWYTIYEIIIPVPYPMHHTTGIPYN